MVTVRERRNGRGLISSRYLRSRQRPNYTVVFHELHPDPVYLPTDEWLRYEQQECGLPSAVEMALQERGLLIGSAREDDAAFDKARADLLTRLDTASILYLVLVQDCNFACSYCPIPALARKHGRQRMTAATTRLAVDIWADHISADPIDGEYCAILYGGEPLLNLPTLVAAVDHIETLQREGRLPARERLSLMACTNGYLVDDSFAEFCREHRISVTVGCDGPKEAHDPIRRTTQDQDTFDLVLKGIRTLVGAGVTTFASTSITPSNIDHLDHLPDFFRNLGVAKYGLNFLRGQLLFRLVPMAELPAYYEKATDGVLDNVRTANEHLEYQLERKMLTYLERRFFPTDCNGYGNQLVVDPHGQVGNCPFLAGNAESVHSALNGFRMSATPQAQQWRARLPLFNPHCHSCDAKSICGGGCAWNAIELKGDPLEIDDAMCMLTRKLFNVLVWSGAPADSEAADDA